MRSKPSICFTLAAVFLFGMFAACAGPQKPSAPLSSEIACIEGVVNRLDPDAAMAPFAYVIVTAWRQGTEQGLAEVKADEDGRYCIEVPAGVGTVELRTWGTERFGGKTYLCEGSADGIDLGTLQGRCGSGGCLEMDISAKCTERVERRRGR